MEFCHGEESVHDFLGRAWLRQLAEHGRYGRHALLLVLLSFARSDHADRTLRLDEWDALAVDGSDENRSFS
jgi:hypothetical protein